MTSDGHPFIDKIVHEPSQAFAEQTNVQKFMEDYGIDTYEELIDRTCREQPDSSDSGIDWFWDLLPSYLDIEFATPYDRVRDNTNGPQFTDWYPGGKLNIAHNAVDRHAEPDTERRNKAAIIWEGELGEVRQYTYHDLHQESNRVANALTELDVTDGDTVGIFMPMLPETASAFYGCLKIGAIPVPIFSGFGTEAVAKRLSDAGCNVLLGANGFYRRGTVVSLTKTMNGALAEAGCVEHTVLLDRVDTDEKITEATTHHWSDAIEDQSSTYDSVIVDSDHPALLIYSSGTTGNPKGIIHSHAGLQLQTAKEVYFGFDHKDSDRFFWVSDLGWLMGPWALVGNHSLGGTVFMYEGAPDYPNPDRYWDMIERHSLTTFGISPTAIRTLQQHGTDWVSDHDLSSIRILGSTGGPWDGDSWNWFYENVGNGTSPIINISGGTEIGGSFLMPMPNQQLKPCSLGGPSLGMNVDIVDESGQSVQDDGERGYLVARSSCPGFTNSLWSGDERYLEEYWSTWDGIWDHGDWAQKDEDGFWYILGRADDALNVAGRKVGPAEIEDVLNEHPAVNQSAVCGVSDETTGTAVVGFVILEPSIDESIQLQEELTELIAAEHGKPFRPRELVFVNEFPKTQSGKVIRRALSAIYDRTGTDDIKSIENPKSVRDIKNKLS